MLACLPASAFGAGFEVTKWEAGTCTNIECTDQSAPTYFYTQAAGHPDFGITDFRFKAKEAELLGHKWEEPLGHVKNVRVDLPPGLAINPEATKALCTAEELESDKKECPSSSQLGIDYATGTAEVALGIKETVKEEFPVYNMERLPGEPSRFGVEINSAKLEALALAGFHLQGHIYLEGGISWQPENPDSENSGVTTGDYHEYFKIPEISEKPEVIESRLVFWGVPQEHQTAPTELPTAFITLPSTCASNSTTYLHVDSREEPTNYLEYANETPVKETGCSSLAFNPSVSLTAETAQSDEPDGITTDLHVPQLMSEPSKSDSPDVQNAQITLPEGMTLDPSAAHGLEACSNTQYAASGCPAGAKVGTVSVNAPGIPNGSLTGGVYVGSPQSGNPESGEMYRLFVIAIAPQYGVGLRVEGRVSANAQTGRLTATFSNAPQVPFEDFTLHFKGGPRAPVANPLGCGAVVPSGSILPYGSSAKSPGALGFAVSGCASPLPFSLVQSLTAQNAQAGAFSPFTFNLTRADGQQYLSSLTTTLPPGLVGAIPSVPLCGEAEANAGKCSSSSEIGTVTVAAGAGAEPYTFTGHAYLTGKYDGDPYGLSVVVPAVAGPYNLGEVVTRAGISVGLYNSRVTVTSDLPTVVGGVPLRLKSLSVDVNRANFASNPTSCAPFATESVLTSTFGAVQSLSSPFQVNDCGALAFSASVSASSGANTSKLGGASIEVKVTEGAHQANIHELQLQLPKQLVARLSTLQKACLAAEFEAGTPPGTCKSTARVGTATVSTPVLPDPLKGNAYFVSHGAAAFPDLDLVLQGDGVEVVLVGRTHIARSSITTSTFESLPDVPFSSAVVTLPVGSNSALAANGALCRANLLAPTTLVGQNGAKLTKDTRIAVNGCPIQVLSHRRRGRRLIVKVWVPEAGRVSVTGRGVKSVSARVQKAGQVIKLSVPLTAAGTATLARGRHTKLRLRVGFVPRHGHNTSATTLRLR